MMKSSALRIGRAYSPEEGVLPARIKASVAMHVSATLGLSRKLHMPCPIVTDSSPWLQPPFSCWVRTSQANPRRTLSLEGCWDEACVSAADTTLFFASRMPHKATSIPTARIPGATISFPKRIYIPPAFPANLIGSVEDDDH